MKWIERLNEAINYIEENITEKIDYEQLAKIACCSSYHFQRMFAYIADVPLSEYIRRRRMSLAVTDLQKGEKIIDIAVKYGYDSPTAFNRAFQNIHGISPSLAKQDGIILKTYPLINFKMNIKGSEEIKFRLEKKDAFRIVGIIKKLDKDFEENGKIVPGMWKEAKENGTIKKLTGLMEGSSEGIFGISASKDLKEWQYYIAVATTKKIDKTLVEFTVPSLTWAVFCGGGHLTETMHELEKRIITEWFPTFGYEYNNGPNIAIEWYPKTNYDNLNLTPSQQIPEFEIWIPVNKTK